MPSEQSLLQTSGARTMFGVFNDSSRARLNLDLGKEVDDVWKMTYVCGKWLKYLRKYVGNDVDLWEMAQICGEMA